MNVYQKIVDRLCNIYNIPSIPVIIVEDDALSSNRAYFDNIEYTITIEPSASANDIIHEWTHYCICLISSVGDLEENLCDWVPTALISEIEDDRPELHALLQQLEVLQDTEPETLNND